MFGFEGTVPQVYIGPVAQLVRASPCHGEGRRFESDLGRLSWDLSSAGRASALQAEGHRFEPYRSHLKKCWCNSKAGSSESVVEYLPDEIRRCGSIGRAADL